MTARASPKTQTGLAFDEALLGQAGLATYVAARMYGDFALPSTMPDWLRRAIEEQAEQGQRLAGTSEWTIGGAGGGPANRPSREEREEEQRRETLAAMRETFEEVERERERVQWMKTSHALGTVEMTGQEWQEFGSELRREGDLRKWLLSKLRSDGKTEDEAEIMAERVASIAEIMAKPENQRTEQELAELERAKQDKELQNYLEDAADRFAEQKRNGPKNEAERTIATGQIEESTTARADELSASTGTNGRIDQALASVRSAKRPEPESASPLKAVDPAFEGSPKPLTQRPNVGNAGISGFDI